MSERHELTRTHVDTRCTIHATCPCGSENVDLRALDDDSAYELICDDCPIVVTIPPELLTVGENEWLADRGIFAIPFEE